jgi:serine/threonine protein kinase
MPPADPSLSLAQRIDAICDRFEADWKAGRRQPVEAYLADVPTSEQDAVRSAVLAVKQELETHDRSVDSSAVPDSDRTGAYRPQKSPPAQIGRFEILALLGEGAFGRVYKARDPQLDRDVAIKVPKVEAFAGQFDLQRFLREAKSAAAVQHPNICPVHEVNSEGDQPYIVMAYVPGKSLAEHLRGRTTPMPPKQAVLIVRKLALALQAAHDKGIVHRDLKPANILFDPQRKEVVITDFGLAVRTSGGDVRQTQSGMLLGTPAYMSPEQARGDVKQVGPASDIFALGVILYELLTNQRPFQGSLGEVIGQIQHIEPPSIRSLNPQLDERLDAICRRALAKNPADRFPSMKALADALDAYLRDQPTAATTTQKAKEADPEQSVGMAQVLERLLVGVAGGPHRQPRPPRPGPRPRRQSHLVSRPWHLLRRVAVAA